MLSKEAVEQVAKLARLKLTDGEVAAFSEQLSNVLQNFEKITGVDTRDVAPLVTPTEMTQVLRQDTVKEEAESEKFLANAPEKSGRLYKVPPVV